VTVRRSEQIQAQLEEAVTQGASTADVVSLAAELASTVGECHIGTEGTADLYPVLDEDGMRWCCTHEEMHCTVVVAELRR
jgi:hypothetical protein